jgi:hypothetical protein
MGSFKDILNAASLGVYKGDEVAKSSEGARGELAQQSGAKTSGKHGWFEKTEAEKERERQEQLKAAEEAKRRAAEEAKREAERQEAQRAYEAQYEAQMAPILSTFRRLSPKIREVLEDYVELYGSASLKRRYEVKEEPPHRWWAGVAGEHRTNVFLYEENMLSIQGHPREWSELHRQSKELALALYRATGLRVKVSGARFPGEATSTFSYIVPDEEDYPLYDRPPRSSEERYWGPIGGSGAQNAGPWRRWP